MVSLQEGHFQTITNPEGLSTQHFQRLYPYWFLGSETANIGLLAKNRRIWAPDLWPYHLLPSSVAVGSIGP